MDRAIGFVIWSVTFAACAVNAAWAVSNGRMALAAFSGLLAIHSAVCAAANIVASAVDRKESRDG